MIDLINRLLGHSNKTTTKPAINPALRSYRSNSTKRPAQDTAGGFDFPMDYSPSRSSSNTGCSGRHDSYGGDSGYSGGSDSGGNCGIVP